MRGFVPTPAGVVDQMVDQLFRGRPPTQTSTVLDPGCGPGAFVDGVLRWCTRNDAPLPRIVGVELDSHRYREAAQRYQPFRNVEIRQADFLQPCSERFDYVIGNPPYVSILGLSERERDAYRRHFDTACGRFDLYMLFFEQALRQLKPGGRLVFVTPEKFLYVETARALRRLLSGVRVREIRLLDEATFGPKVTYPAVTTIENCPPRGGTWVILRDGSRRLVTFPADGAALLPQLHDAGLRIVGGPTLADVCARISCGIATGADEIFVKDLSELTPTMAKRAYPTISGRELVPGKPPSSSKRMLIPYDSEGNLLPLEALGDFGTYLKGSRRHLEARTCARRKPWHAFHDSVPLGEILTPKVLCKDIAAEPHFWVDQTGAIVPRHSVYYLIPRHADQLPALVDYLRSEEATRWLRANCQRAANGFLRLQSSVLKRLPVPAELIPRGAAA